VSDPPAIPPADPAAGMRARRAEILAAMERVLEGNRYILGPEVEAFEHEFAAWLGLAAVAGVATGTDAIMLALKAAGVGAGDEVITVSHTAVGSVTAIEAIGAVPVLADIDLASYTLDPASAAAAISTRTKALLPVHLYGHPAALEPLQALATQHDLLLIEDCAQAHGAEWRGERVGRFGAAAAFSFYPTKNLGGIGDGGAVGARDAAVIERVRVLRQYGWHERYVSDECGWNSRLDELQAAILRVRLAGLDTDNARRRAIASHYLAALADSPLVLPVERAECVHVWHQFVVRHPRRDAFRNAMKAHGVGTLVHYPVPVHLQPAYRGRLRSAPSMANTERAAAEVVSLPIHPELTDSEVERVALAARDAAREA
jgi:dTDP-4-amino-4,6-dideoxygalactose transaminase